MRVFRFFLFCAIAAFPVPSISQSSIPVEILTGNIDLNEIDALIAENAGRPEIAFDLLALKAEAEVDAGTPAAAAETTFIMAALAQRFPDDIDADIPTLLLDAADLFVAAENLPRAIEQLYAAVDALRERAANRELLGNVLRRIAELEAQRGNSDLADQLVARAENLRGPLSEPPAARSADPGYTNVNVYYATDRAPTGRTQPARFFGHARDTKLNYGLASVTIPRTHQPGTLAAPSVWRLEFSEDPTKHVMLQSVEPVDADGFFQSMRDDLEAQSASDAFVFVHGYNVSFDAAAKRTAQMAYDMNFKGLPILYSWPSRGATIGYISDTAVVRLSGRRLTLFLEDVVNRSGANTIHIVAHSMGNRAVTDALELMALRRQPISKPIFDQIIFAAPDVDQGLFAAMVPTIEPIARRLTLYASEKDWALEASRQLHGDAPRAGQGGHGALSHPSIDTIDMTGLGEDMLSHSYVSNDRSAILDISTLFWLNPEPEERCGLVRRAGAQAIWDHRDAACASQSLLNIISSLRNAQAYSRSEVRETLARTFEGVQDLSSYEGFLFQLANE